MSQDILTNQQTKVIYTHHCFSLSILLASSTILCTETWNIHYVLLSAISKIEGSTELRLQHTYWLQLQSYIQFGILKLWGYLPSQADQGTRSVLDGQQWHTRLWNSSYEPHVSSQSGSTPVVTCTKNNLVLHGKLPSCWKIHHTCWRTVWHNSAGPKALAKYAVDDWPGQTEFKTIHMHKNYCTWQ